MAGPGPVGGLGHRLLQEPAAELGGAVVVAGDPEELGGGEEDALGGAPAGLGGDGGDGAAGEVDDGLVEQGELAVAQGGAQPRGQLGAAHDVGLHLRGVQLDPVLAAGLGAVHREVGVAHEVGGADGGLGEGDADGGGHPDLVGADPVGLGEGEAQPFGDLVHLVLPGALIAGAVPDDERGELVTAEPGGGVAGPDGVLEPPSGLDEQFVARLVADGVVDLFEAVEVDEEDGGARVARPPPAERLADPGGEQGPVGQVGERVVLGVVLQLGLEADPFGDVPAVEQEAALVAVDGGLDVEPVAGAGAEAALDAGGGLLVGRGGEEAPHLVDEPAEVVGVDDRGQLGPDEVLRVAPVDPGGGGADVAQGAVGGGDHDDVAGALHQGAEVVLLLRQFLGEGDAVEQHDALPDDERQDDRAAGEDDDPVDPPAVDHVVQDAQGADGGGEIRGQGGQRPGDRAAAGGPGRGGSARCAGRPPGGPGGVGEEQRTGEPAGVEELARVVGGAQQRRGEHRVAEDGEREGRDGGVHRGAVHPGAAEVQGQHHRDEHDVEQRVGQREGGGGDVRLLRARQVRGVREGEAPGERQQGAADQPGVQPQADPAGPGDGTFGEHQQADDGGRREAEEEDVGEGGRGHGDAEDDLVPAPDGVAAGRHEGREREQQPGGPQSSADRSRVKEAGDGGDQRGGGEAEVPHEDGDARRSPAHGGAHRIPRADDAEQDPGARPGGAGGGPRGEQGPQRAHRRAPRPGPAGQSDPCDRPSPGPPRRRPLRGGRGRVGNGCAGQESGHRRARCPVGADGLGRSPVPVGSSLHGRHIARRPLAFRCSPRAVLHTARLPGSDDTPERSRRAIAPLLSVTKAEVSGTVRIRTAP